MRNFITKKHNKVLHNKTSMAVLIKVCLSVCMCVCPSSILLPQSRLSVEAERNFIHPHTFVQVEVSKKKQCNFCKHTLHQKTGMTLLHFVFLIPALCNMYFSIHLYKYFTIVSSPILRCPDFIISYVYTCIQLGVLRAACLFYCNLRYCSC